MSRTTRNGWNDIGFSCKPVRRRKGVGYVLNFVLPAAENQVDVLAFYCEMAQSGDACIGMGNYENYVLWLTGMQNRHTGHNLPDGYCGRIFICAMKAKN